MKLHDLHKTDPEFAERFEYFAFDEVVNDEDQKLPERIRWMVVLAALTGCGGTDAYRQMLPEALDSGITPETVKEIVYQAVDYLGYGRVLPFLEATNGILQERGVGLPLEGQATTTLADRLEKGVEAQEEIFGPQMKEAWKSGTVNRWLASNCFGDYYTRRGLTLAERELITFCFLMAQGGCEPQLTAHCKGNMNVGNDREFLMRAAAQCVPYIGYPRVLNALNCIGNAAELPEKE